MALFDLGKIGKKLQEAGQGIAKNVSDAAGKLPEVGEEFVKTASGAAEKISGVGKEIEKTVNDVAGKIPKIKPEETADKETDATEGASVQAGQDELNNEASDLAEEDGQEEAVKDASLNQELETMAKTAEDITIPEPEATVSIEGALKIIYCLMAVDGVISPEEKEKYNLIGREMDSKFENHMDAFIHEYEIKVKGAEDPEEYYEMVHDYVSELILSFEKSKNSGIRGKLLLWNLYAIVYSDECYSEEERRLIRYICRALRIDKAVAAEMENTLKTLMAIETEENWIKAANRQYKIIEDRLNELADRKQTIMKSIHELIAD